MVTVSESQQLDLIFAALADPTRRAIIARLSTSDVTVGELAEPFAMSRPAISKHLDVLERAGLVVRLSDGRQNRCVLTGAPLRDAADWVLSYRRVWTDQFDALAKYFDHTPESL